MPHGKARTRTTWLIELNSLIGEFGKPTPLFVARKKECQTMNSIHGADDGTATASLAQTKASASLPTASTAETLTLISDIVIDDGVATRPEWKRLWQRLLAPRCDDVA